MKKLPFILLRTKKKKPFLGCVSLLAGEKSERGELLAVKERESIESKKTEAGLCLL